MKIACLADLHLRGKGLFGSDRSDLLNQLVHYSRQQDVDHIIICGDLVRTLGDPKNKYHFTPLRTKLKKANYYSYNRCTYIPGNHDYKKYRLFARNRNPQILRDIMLKLDHKNKKPMSYRYPFIKVSKGVAIVGINTVSATGDNRLWGDITEKQYYELRRVLKIASYNDTPIIVAMHHPPWDIPDYEERIMKAFEEFNVKTVVYGHTHENEHRIKSGVHYYCVGGAYDEGKLLVIDIDRGRTVRPFMRWKEAEF